MKATLLTRDFSKLLTTSTRFVASRANLPILGNIVLNLTKSKLEVLATDLEISLCGSLGAKVEEEGEIAVPAKTFTELIGNLGGETVDIETKGETVTVSSEGFKSAVNAINTSDFPKVPKEVSEASISLEARIFVPALNKILFATSTDEARPSLTGVLFLFHKNEIALVATDGFRLSQKKLDIASSLEDKSLIIPKRILSELPRLATGKEVLFEIKESENQVLFGLDNAALASRVIEGEFPNFERIIPKVTATTVNVSKEELGRAIKLSSIFARDNANTVKLTIKEGELVVSAESSKSGQEELSIPAKTEGQNLEISFNYRYIEEFLNVVAGGSVEIKANSETTPCMFLDPKDASFLHIIMPVRV